jgi:hypothetical protein
MFRLFKKIFTQTDAVVKTNRDDIWLRETRIRKLESYKKRKLNGEDIPQSVIDSMEKRLLNPD